MSRGLGDVYKRQNNNLARYSLLKYSEKFATLNLKMQEGEVQSERESEKGAGVDF